MKLLSLFVLASLLIPAASYARSFNGPSGRTSWQTSSVVKEVKAKKKKKKKKKKKHPRTY